ncbi:MAG: electron transport complex subunit RsxC [Candidatus Omnitrophica bacterium]|nr:electron transport complex subunit RsxC [Candidatus Omnitrophota bacterium]
MVGLEKPPLPKQVYIPLSQHTGKACIPEVRPGESVVTGQRIAGIQAAIWAPVHASLSGKVTAVQDWPHPVLGRAKAIVIESNGEDRVAEDKRKREPEEVNKLTSEEIRNLVFSAGIVGMGGASFPTHIKLNPPKPVDTLIINGAECEPYLMSDYRLMVEKTGEIIKGIELITKCLGVKRVIVAIEENKPEAIKNFNYELRITCLAGRQANYELRILKSQYPQGGEKQLIKNLLKKEVPRGKLPFDVGVVVHNVATCFAIYEAVYLNKPLYERIVTVTGSCVLNSKVLLVRIGTPIKELIAFCGLKEEPAKIILGGPMMGIAQFTDEVPVIKSTTGIILFNQKEARIYEEGSCIRCGACIRECPVGLMPCLINLATERGLWQKAKDYGALDCIECGLCSFACPAKRRLVQSIRRAKLELGK